MISYKANAKKYYYVVKVLDPLGKDDMNYIVETHCSNGAAIAMLMQSSTKYSVKISDYGTTAPKWGYETFSLDRVVAALSRLRYYNIVEYEQTIVVKKTKTVEL
jgi:hypothetical protein